MRKLWLASLVIVGAFACQTDNADEDEGGGGSTPLLPTVTTTTGPGAGAGPGVGGSGGAGGAPTGPGGNMSAGGTGGSPAGSGGGGGGTACSTAPALGDLVINEIHSAPDSSSHDVNCDAAFSQQDEFIEIVNVSNNDLDMAGVELTENGTVRHTFSGCLNAGRAIVIYNQGLTPMCGAGDWGDTQGVAASDTFTLTNSGGEDIGIQSTAGVHDTVNTLNLGGNPRTSMTRSPDLTGAFVEHDTVGGAFSVGRCLDASLFPCN